MLLILFLININRVGRALYPFPYRDIVFYYSKQYNLDPYLVIAIIKTESNFNPYAISRKEAKGLMQIMPDTGQWVASEIGFTNFNAEKLFIPEINIQIGSWYLANLHKEFSNNTILVLAAYNGGRGNVTKWLSEGVNRIDQIPFPETRKFVRKVMWNHKVYRYLYERRESI